MFNVRVIGGEARYRAVSGVAVSWDDKIEWGDLEYDKRNDLLLQFKKICIMCEKMHPDYVDELSTEESVSEISQKELLDVTETAGEEVHEDEIAALNTTKKTNKEQNFNKLFEEAWVLMDQQQSSSHP